MFTIAGSGNSATVTASESIIQTLDSPLSAFSLIAAAMVVAGVWFLDARSRKTISGRVDS
jgi:hypothetical protein